jgi:protein tyrosine phosphatase (PTP) superfamily phosphohydrolase (DUF442 family)
MDRLSRSLALAAGTTFTVLGLTGCQHTSTHAAPEVVITAPPATAGEAVALAGLHNVVTYTPGVLGGGQPEGRQGLETLAAMGIRTIISVDGATPDVAEAQALGMRYVHLPISYDTVMPERQRELARALHSCDGPIYLHCHHGKHRSGAALGTALVLCGKLTPEQARARMKVSGTAKEYTGLWQVVAAAEPLPVAALRADPASFPSVAKVSGMVATMAEIDLVFDLVKQAHQAGWQAPTDHPDLVPKRETRRMQVLFAQLRRDPDSVKHPEAYQTLLGRAIAASEALDAAVQADDHAQADALLETLGKGCKECHKSYRDV